MMDFIVSCERRWQRNKVARMAEWDSIPGSTTESTDLNETAKCERTWGGGGGVVRYEYRPSPPFVLPRLQMQVEDFRSAGVKLLLGAVFINSRASTHRSSGALAHLRVCSTRRPDFTYSPPSLACKCELEDFHPMQGV